MLKEMKGGENVDFGACRLKVFGAVTHKLLLRKTSSNEQHGWLN